MVTSKKNRRHRKFFIKENDEISVVTPSYFTGLSKEDAVGIGVQTYLELKRQMVRDFEAGHERRIGSIPVVEGLQRSLAALREKYPFLMKEVFAVERRLYGQRLFQA
jgi:hypothetical protein